MSPARRPGQHLHDRANDRRRRGASLRRGIRRPRRPSRASRDGHRRLDAVVGPRLLHGARCGGGLVWGPHAFRAAPGGGGGFAIRYAPRDTGRSTSDPPGRPTYTGDDLVADAARVLDGYGIARAHVVGVSMGGALAQLLALDFPARVASLVLLSTSPAGPADD